MKRGKCSCKSPIFFGNSLCLTCGSAVGQCTSCHRLGSFSPLAGDVPDADGLTHVCDQCGERTKACIHHANGFCNSYVTDENELCYLCQFTRTVPNAADPTDLSYWADLERAKRRVLLQLEQLDHLPPFSKVPQATPPLIFDFRKDLMENGEIVERVYTGHGAGVITINLREADSVYREQTRIELGEPQRTLIGHFRHEYGHYLDLCFDAPKLRQQSIQLFGDPQAQAYEDAKAQYYQHGPDPNWRDHFVSAYATMHPWEDFAETVNAYLDLTAIAESANDQNWAAIDYSVNAKVAQFVPKVLKFAVAASEFNLDMGLPVLLPESMPPPVLDKLEFIHSLRRAFLHDKATAPAPPIKDPATQPEPQTT